LKFLTKFKWLTFWDTMYICLNFGRISVVFLYYVFCVIVTPSRHYFYAAAWL